MTKRVYFIIFVLCIVKVSNSQTLQLENNEHCKQIYHQISALKIDESTKEIFDELKAKPNNAMPLLLANYIDFYELFFNENPTEYEKRKLNESKRIDILNTANPNSPLYLHAKAMIYLQWGLIKLKFKDYFSAAKDVRKAFQLFNENKVKFPQSNVGDAYIGSLQAAIGTIPGEFKWVANLLGMKGNLNSGVALIQKALNNSQNIFPEDALFFYVYVKQYLQNEPKQAWQELKKYRTKTANNRLLTFMTANIAVNQNKADEVIKVVLENYNQKGFLQIPILDYELGCAYLYKLDDNSIYYFSKYINNFRGKFYLKDAYYRMAMMKYIAGDNAKATQFANAILQQKNSDADADKNAQQFAKNMEWPNKDLLKIRFLYDGGYFQKALQIAKKFQPQANTLLEYNYRKARIFDEINNKDSAIQNYLTTIQLGKTATTYFAARAALQLAMLYEAQNKKELAFRYFTLSMNMENREYKNSIDMRAKAGLQRLGK